MKFQVHITLFRTTPKLTSSKWTDETLVQRGLGGQLYSLYASVHLASSRSPFGLYCGPSVARMMGPPEVAEFVLYGQQRTSLACDDRVKKASALAKWLKKGKDECWKRTCWKRDVLRSGTRTSPLLAGPKLWFSHCVCKLHVG